MKALTNIFNWWVYSNLLIAFGAAAQVILSYWVIDLPLNRFVVLVEWSSTLLLYNFAAWISMPKSLSKTPIPRTKWYFTHSRFIFSLSLLAFLIFIYSLIHLHAYSIYLLIVIGILCLGYVLPVIHTKNKYISLRAVAGLKVFLIALVWALSTVGLPILEYISTELPISWYKALIWSLLVFIFILSITIPFDIRDIRQDDYYKLKTLPILIGVYPARILCYFLIILHSITIIIVDLFPSSITWPLIAVDVLVIVLFYTSLFRDKSTYKEVYALDLVLILQTIIVIAWSLLQ